MDSQTLINADFRQRVVIDTQAQAWIASPEPGVDRQPLDRIGGEQARATSLVRYAAGSNFSAHQHGGGEEFLVLDGTFSDEHGDYPAGTYVRNPPGSRHRPFSREGCTLFVKLRQFAPDARVVSDRHSGGEEVLVLEGVLSDEAGHYSTGVWVRDPPGSSHAPFSELGCVIYVKEGHLNC